MFPELSCRAALQLLLSPPPLLILLLLSPPPPCLSPIPIFSHPLFVSAQLDDATRTMNEGMTSAIDEDDERIADEDYQ
ncbi:hypothetical protein Droror1_Dr00020296, partial [Drosera rotundifolia]